MSSAIGPRSLGSAFESRSTDFARPAYQFTLLGWLSSVRVGKIAALTAQGKAPWALSLTDSSELERRASQSAVSWVRDGWGIGAWRDHVHGSATPQSLIAPRPCSPLPYE